MPLVDFSEFMDHVLAEVRLAPEDLAVQKMREVARDFCRFTRAWQQDGPPQTILENVATYNIVPPGNAEPVALEYVAVDMGGGAFPSVPKSVEWFDKMIPTWRTRKASDFRFYTQLTRKTFTFPGLPTENGVTNGLTYRMSLMPGSSSAEIDEDVWAEWHEVIAKGTKAELLVMDGERWANINRGVDYRQQYQRARALARVKVQRGYAASEQHWQSPYKFGVR